MGGRKAGLAMAAVGCMMAAGAAAAADVPANIAAQSARDIVAGVAAGRWDACAVATATLARIAADGHNAFITTRTAKDLPSCGEASPPRGALAGLPVAIKDNVLVAGQKATFGTSATKDFVPTETASAVQRLIDQGAVVVGKLNLHELAGGVTSNNAVFGAVRNAYDAACFAGGSSGGAGAAVGARLVPVALGTDTGGSVLIPAALNGVVGYRPTVGRYPMDGVLPVSSSRDTLGPIAHSVADIIAVDAVLAQSSESIAPAQLKGLRIGVPRRLFVDVADKESRTQFDAVLQLLTKAGAEVVDIELPGLVEAENGFGPITPYELKTQVPAFLARYHVGVSFEQLVAGIRSPDLVKDYQTRIVGPASPTREAYDVALTFKPVIQAVFRDAFTAHKLTALAFPTTLTDARPIEGSDDTITMDGTALPTWKAYINNTNFLTKGSLAALTLPMGVSSRRLPLGVSFAVLPRHDSELLALGLAVEPLLPRLPPPPAATK
ncbi:MAG: amidase family protein [Pseudomonadota bacterium]